MHFNLCVPCVCDIGHTVELHDLRYFVSAADNFGFSRAAANLGLSQPALSRQIKSLENELGVLLFDRIGRRTVLTAAGTDLLQRARVILHQSDSLKARAHELAGGARGILRLGATPHSYESFVARLLAKLRRGNPEIEVSLIEDGAAKLLSAVRTGAIHLAIASLPHGSGLQGRPLFPFGLIAVFPKSHPLAGRRTVEVTQITGCPLLLMHRSFLTRQLFEQACHDVGVEPQVLIESNSGRSLVALAEQGHGVAVVPSTMQLNRSHHRASPIQFKGRAIGLWMSVIWDGSRYLTPAVKIFVEVAFEFTRRWYPGKAFHFERLGRFELPK
jgi:DNA-binding transcriptional LysR family regulator